MITWGEHKVSFQYLSVLFFFKATACTPLLCDAVINKRIPDESGLSGRLRGAAVAETTSTLDSDATAAVHTICKARDYVVFAPASLCHNDLAV